MSRIGSPGSMTGGMQNLSGIDRLGLFGSNAPVPPVASPTFWLYPGNQWQDLAKTSPATANNDPVRVWADISGNGHDVSASSDPVRPLIVASALNGFAGVQASGATHVLSATYTYNSDWSVWFVIKPASGNDAGFMGQGGQPALTAPYMEFSNFPAATRLNVGYSVGNAFIDLADATTAYGVVENNGSNTGETFRYRSASQSVVSTTFHTALNNLGGITIFAGTQAVTIVEVIGYGALGSTDRNTVFNALGARYGLF